MNDQLAIGEMICRILGEFGYMPRIDKHEQEELYRVNSVYLAQFVACVEKSLEDCLASIYNQMKRIQEEKQNG